MTGNNTKLRAVTLAALMVLSVMVGSIAFTGAAAASNHSASDTRDAYSYDANVTSDTNRWHGQDLYLHGENDDDNATYELYEVDSDGATTLETQMVLDENATYILDSSNLDAGSSYVVRDDAGDYRSVDSDGIVSTTNNSDPENAAFTVIEQTFSAQLQSDSVKNGGSADDRNVDLKVNSNRGKFDVHVTWDGAASASTIVEAFNDNYAATKVDDSTVKLSGVSSGTNAVNMSGVDAGNYTFNFNVADTSASDSDDLTVSEVGEGEASFAADLAQVPQGDVAWFTVNLEDTDTASLTIGSEDVNYVENVTVTDGDGDGKVTVGFNTYAAGKSGADVVTTKGDDDTATLDDPVTLSNILDTGSYDMSVVAGGDNFGEEADDLATLSVQARQTVGHTVYTAPGSDSIDEVVSDSTLTEREDVTTSDYQVHQIEATGIFGLLASYDGDDAETQLYNAVDNGSVSFTAEEQNPGSNQDPLTFNYTKAYENDPSAFDVVTDANNNSVYVVVDSSAEVYLDGDGNNVSAESGDNFNATFSVNEASGLAGEDGESVSADYSVVDAETELNVNDDDLVVVNPGEGQAISGSTNLAPGTAFNLRVQSESSDAPFIKTATELTVQADGTFSGTFDFSDVPVDTEFTVSARTGGSSVDTASGVVQEEQTTTTTTTTAEETTTTTAEETTTTTAEETTTTTTEEPTTTTTTEEETPGFGVVVGLIAMLGAALLALRREN